MRKIKNPYDGLEGYNCFGCSPKNPCGLKMEFFEDGHEIVCTWNPQDHFCGYGTILHGGIQSSLMDEIASWVVFTRLGTAGFTSSLKVRFLRQVHTDRGPLSLRAVLIKKEKNIANISVRLFDAGGTLCADGEIKYFTLSETLARKKFHYPGHEHY